MAKTVFVNGDPSSGALGTILTAEFLNKVFAHRHDGLDQDGSAPIDYAVDTGAADAYAIALTPALTVYIPGMRIAFKASHANTGASTLNVNGLGAKDLVDHNGIALKAGAIPANAIMAAVYDGAKFQLDSPEGVTGGLIGIQVFSAPGTHTYTPTPGTKSVVVELVGGGGGGAGEPACDGSHCVTAGGGGGGGLARSRLTTGFLGVTVTVGAGGAGGAAGANNGNNGGTSSFGSLLSATGGTRALSQASRSTGSLILFTGCGAGGAGSGGNILNASGGAGFFGAYDPGVLGTNAGNGGSSFYGPGAVGGSLPGGLAGTDASSPGEGGCSASVPPGASAFKGGKGGDGIVTVYEFA